MVDLNLVRLKLATKVGLPVMVTYSHHHPQRVIVVSVDSDGVLCRTVPSQREEEEAEFWLPFTEITDLNIDPQPPLST